MSVICMPAAVCGAAPAASANKTLMQIITDLSLTTNLKLCLDAGDADSYNPAVQTAKWLDTSGNGCDFYRGTSTGGDGAEPTFNGSAGGLSSNEYFSFDGGDYFSYDSANEAWMNALHNDGAVWSVFCVFYPPHTTTALTLFGTAGTAGSNYGAALIRTSANGLVARYTDTTTLAGASANSFATTANAWNVVGVGISENGGASGSSYLTKNGSGTWDSSNTLASPSSPAGDCTIGATSNKSNIAETDTRLACLAVWEGTALTSTNLTALYDAIKGRFGL